MHRHQSAASGMDYLSRPFAMGDSESDFAAERDLTRVTGRLKSQREPVGVMKIRFIERMAKGPI